MRQHFGPDQGQDDITGCKLYCEQEGKGTPIVIVSGGPGCSHQLLRPYFSRAAKFAKVIYYDQRGAMLSEPWIVRFAH